jgi:signal transduction histidine kinase
VERRIRLRRAADRAAHDEAVLLARSLDLLAGPGPAERRLGGLLALLARVAGAQRAAVLAEADGRRIAVGVAPDEDPAAAEALAAWLDAHAPRSRSARAATGPASVARIVAVPTGETKLLEDGGMPGSGAPTRAAIRPERSAARASRRVATRGRSVPPEERGAAREPVPWCCPVPDSGGTVLGFHFRSGRAAKAAADRLPPALARHAAVALALVTAQLLEERELELLRARETQRQRFVSTVAHELRTPLTSLAGYLELILDDRVPDPVDRREFLERSRGLVDMMGALVADLLEMSRLESGNLELEIVPFSGAEAAQTVITALHPQALAAGVTLEGRLPSRLRTVLADRRRLIQVLTNVTGNALKFTPPGGHVTVSLEFVGPIALFAVRDDGPGIAAAELERVFERFFRAPGATTVNGTGLGLSIARDLARAMGGDIAAASDTGAGATFLIALPTSATAGDERLNGVLLEAQRTEAARRSQGARAARTARAHEVVTIPA